MKFRNLSISLLLMMIHSLGIVSSQNWRDLLGVGRSIAGMISSGIQDFKDISKDLSRKEKKIQNQDYSGNEFISTDDLFNGLNDVWDKKINIEDAFEKEEKDVLKNESPQIENEIEQTHEAYVLQNQSSQIENEIEQTAEAYVLQNQSSQIENEIEQTPEEHDGASSLDKNMTQGSKNTGKEPENNHWMRIKSIVGNMKSIFLETYGYDSEEKLGMAQMLDKIIQIGDKINLVQTVGNSFDEDLIMFLKDKWENVERDSLRSNPIIKAMLSVDGKVLLLTIAKGLVKQFGGMFHQHALAHINEQDFVIRTMRVSGFKDSEILDVFQLLDLPTHELVSTSTSLQAEDEGRAYISFGSLFGRSGGYGDSHHGGGGYGYKEMMKKDPLVLLAGLAFAAFAAYLLYRLLSSTPAIARRSSPDVSISLAMSDMPEVMSNLYNWIEKAEYLYGSYDEETNETKEDQIIQSVNELWESYKMDRMSKSCVDRYLCHYLESNSHGVLRYGANLEQLSLLGLAEIVGKKGVGKKMDHHMDQILKGNRTDCKGSYTACDDDDFNLVVKRKNKS